MHEMTQFGPITASGFGGVVCASLEALLVDVELLLETLEAVCKSKSVLRECRGTFAVIVI